MSRTMIANTVVRCGSRWRMLRAGGVCLLLCSYVLLSGCKTGNGAHPETVLDHFLCYEGKGKVPPLGDPQFQVRDQFDRKKKWRQGYLDRPLAFCNPVAKRALPYDRPVQHKDHHLAGYQVEVAGVDRWVEIENQMTGYHWSKVQLKRALWFLVPAQKLHPREHPAPAGLDHYLCYEPSPAEANRKVALQDQFTKKYVDAKVGRLRAFCNPADKKRKNRRYDRQKREAHLACYEVEMDFRPPPRVGYKDQFHPRGVDLPLEKPWALCVPSKKRTVE